MNVKETYLARLRTFVEGTRETYTAEKVEVFSKFHLHVVHKQWMVSSCRDDANFDPVLWVPIQELIIHKHLQITTTNIQKGRTNKWT